MPDDDHEKRVRRLQALADAEWKTPRAIPPWQRPEAPFTRGHSLGVVGRARTAAATGGPSDIPAGTAAPAGESPLRDKRQSHWAVGPGAAECPTRNPPRS